MSDHSQSVKANNEKEKRIVNRVIRCENHLGTLRNYNMKFSYYFELLTRFPSFHARNLCQQVKGLFVHFVQRDQHRKIIFLCWSCVGGLTLCNCWGRLAHHKIPF